MEPEAVDDRSDTHTRVVEIFPPLLLLVVVKRPPRHVVNGAGGHPAARLSRAREEIEEGALIPLGRA